MIEGLVFEIRADDAPYRPDQSGENLQQEFDMLLTEESWKNPEEFGHIESSFVNHIAMIAKRSEELGIVNEYSTELLELGAEVDQIYQSMISYDNFYQMMCNCPEDFGMSEAFANSIFDQARASHGANDGHDHERHEQEDEWEIGPDGKKRRRKKLGWFSSK